MFSLTNGAQYEITVYGILRFENGRLASAHAIHNGFTALEGEIHKLAHGQKVAYGVLNQLVLEGYAELEILLYVAFLKEIKLPTNLKDLHLENAAYEVLLKIGELATVAEETSHNMNPELTPEQIADAILAVNAITTT